MDLSQQIKTCIDGKREHYTTLLQRMVQQPSTVGNEQGVQTIVAEKLHELDLEVDVWEPDYQTLSQNPFFNSTRKSFKGSPNVVGVLPGSGGGHSIMLNGHIDVVPAGDLDPWEDDPFSGKVKDGKLFGRGATDMKGGNLALIIALETIKEMNLTLKGDIIFCSVIEEESGGSGTLSAIEKGYKADVALIPEPSQMKIFPKQQGSNWFRLKVKGISAHGGTRYEGVSAIDKGVLVYQTLLELEKKRNDRITDPLYADNPIPIPLNVGSFKGGYFPSAVPDHVEIEGRYGIAPGETIEEARQEFEDTLANLAEKDPWFQKHPVEVEWFGLRLPPGDCPLNHAFMDVLKATYTSIKQEEPVIAGSTWGTDGGLLTQAGDIPSVIFGPGTTSMAHFANEYIELDKIFETAEIITHAIIEWCNTNK
ncbi:peptidase [Gracilibacillus caseinilyticus]|uniref:Probable succinyl-diaminopimelate desuccinylase n=1 Tax=Gracilibacillus caseinilyticus TaxID=2932256 RepID=A0ABY4EXC8_9BACI|nr:peptidase [Gracilibacillus caseinilyticus]UOQ48620.1 peptidase [Gracilibacillus caseinilyticus]